MEKVQRYIGLGIALLLCGLFIPTSGYTRFYDTPELTRLDSTLLGRFVLLNDETYTTWGELNRYFQCVENEKTAWSQSDDGCPTYGFNNAYARDHDAVLKHSPTLARAHEVFFKLSAETLQNNPTKRSEFAYMEGRVYSNYLVKYSLPNTRLKIYGFHYALALLVLFVVVKRSAVGKLALAISFFPFRISAKIISTIHRNI